MKKLLPYILILIVLTGVFGGTKTATAAPACYTPAGLRFIPTVPLTDTAGNCVSPNTWREPLPTPPATTGCYTPSGARFIPTTPLTDTASNCVSPNTWRGNTPPPPAGGNGEYKLLAPLKGSDGTPLVKFDTKSPGALGEYINLIITILIGLSAVVAVVMIVVGGIEYMTSELISSKEAGTTKIKDALLGLVIALGAFALLNTINPQLLKSDIVIDPANVVVDIRSLDNPQVPVNGMYGQYAAGADWAEINKNINGGRPFGVPAFVTMNNGGKECTKVGETGCTSTIGLDTTPLHTIHARCPSCALVLTGGSEYWLHSGGTTHKPPNSTIDIASNPALNDYIRAGKPLVPYTRYSNGDGLNYYYEVNHWHVGP